MEALTHSSDWWSETVSYTNARPWCSFGLFLSASLILFTFILLVVFCRSSCLVSMSLFVSKNRKVVFQVYCCIHEVSNLPYVSGLYSVKWKLKDASSIKGVTNRETIQNHTVQFNTVFEFEATMVMHKDTNVLQPCELAFQIKQEVNGGRPEDIGSLTINLSEFANTPNAIKRFLLQNSKINSVMRLTLNMSLIKGDPIYKVPESTSQVLVDDLRGILEEQALRNSVTASSPNGVPGRLKSISHLMKNNGDASAEFVDQIFKSARQQ